MHVTVHLFDKDYPEHRDLRPICISNFRFYRARQTYKDEALNFPTDGVRLEPARNVPVDIRPDVLAPKPLTSLPWPHRAIFHTKLVADKMNFINGFWYKYFRYLIYLFWKFYKVALFYTFWKKINSHNRLIFHIAVFALYTNENSQLIFVKSKYIYRSF